MQKWNRLGGRLLRHFLLALLLPAAGWAQSPGPESRIVQSVNEASPVTLRGNTHPLAQPQFDRGAAPADLPMARMLLLLKRSNAQESALQKLMDDQQDPNSLNYHQWLTPDAFGQQFGPSDQDIQAITTWLQAHGFQVVPASHGRTTIEFSGTALQVQQAFHTEIHKFVVNGEEHWANASDPQIPQAFSPVVAGVVSLHNFPKKPLHQVAGVYTRPRTVGQAKAASPDITLPDSTHCQAAGLCYLVGPYDFATIYNVQPLWNASPAIDGTGQSIAIMAISNINIQDVRDFRSLFGLPASDPQIIVNGPDPGLVAGAETEAVLDVEWSGAVAKGATINLVVAASTNTMDGVDLAAVYAVENRLSPVVSESFGECEFFLGATGNSFQNTIRQQAAAEGITFINASGDEGSASCDRFSGTAPDPATHGLAVSGLASTPYGIAVGGTDFANFGVNITNPTPSMYWNANNGPLQSSAIAYVPETTWNSSCTNNVFVTYAQLGGNADAVCNNSRASNFVETIGGGGGKSNCIASSGADVTGCLGGYAKPSWQVVATPRDGARDIPDVSLFASSGFMDSSYVICEADKIAAGTSCSLNAVDTTFLRVGGTSVAAPAFAGIMALVNQFAQTNGQGNANYVLYKLASSPSQTGLNCNSTGLPSSLCIFNDITAGTIAVPCSSGGPDCTAASSGEQYGVLPGYSAGAGYDLATGLGSVNAYNLVHNWNLNATPTTTTLQINSPSPINFTHGQATKLTVSVTPGGATGDVALIGSPHGSDSIPMGTLTLQGGVASGTTAAFSGGQSYAVIAHYAGDGVHAPSDSSPVTVTVAREPSNPLISIPVFDPTTGKETGNLPSSVSYGSPYVEHVDVGNLSAAISFPPHPVCALFTCATGTVTLMDSLNGGPAMPLGTPDVFPLDANARADYPSIQLPGGTHALTAAYSGDNSYLAGTGSYSLTVTPAPTSTTVSANAGPQGTVGLTYTLSLVANSNSSGIAPTGTFAVYDGGTALSGTLGSLFGISGQTDGIASFGGTFTFNFTAAGTHQLTAKYSGDPNYAASTLSNVFVVAVNTPTTTTITSSASSIVVGNTVTLTAIVDTPNKSPNPAHNVSFYNMLNGTAFTGAVIYTDVIDSSGNAALQASLVVTPPNTEQISAVFNGDANYAGSGSATPASITVISPDFILGPNTSTITVTAGQTGTAQLTINPATSYTSTVMFSCAQSGMPLGSTCSFAPNPAMLSNGAMATTTLSVTTIAPSSSAGLIPVPSHRIFWRKIGSGGGWWLLSAVTGLATLLLLLPGRRRYRSACSLGTICILSLAIGCGTGGSSGGGGQQLAVTTTKLTGSTPKIASQGMAQFSVTVTAAGSTLPVTGTVQFSDNAEINQVVTLTNGQGQAQIPLSLVGTHQVTAIYSGDSLNLSSTSAPFNQVVTGTSNFTIAGQTGTVNHPVTVAMTIN